MSMETKEYFQHFPLDSYRSPSYAYDCGQQLLGYCSQTAESMCYWNVVYCMCASNLEVSVMFSSTGHPCGCICGSSEIML